MTGTALATLIRKKTFTDSTTYPDASLLVDVNLVKDELAIEIQKVRKTIWNMPALDDLVLNQREYAFPADVLNNLIDLEIKFTASGDYVTAKPIARRHYNDVLQESVIINNFDNEKPRYFIRRKAIYILSGAIIAVTEGLKLVYDSFPANLTNMTGIVDLSVDPSTTTHGFPREFHKLWARKVILEYKADHEMKLNKIDLDYEKDLQRELDSFSVANLDETKIGSLPSGQSRSDNGYNN